MKSSFIKFLWFLFRNRAMYRYSRNCKYDFSYIAKNIDSDQYLLDAFTWSESPEGGKFWYDLDVKWCGYER